MHRKVSGIRHLQQSIGQGRVPGDDLLQHLHIRLFLRNLHDQLIQVPLHKVHLAGFCGRCAGDKIALHIVYLEFLCKFVDFLCINTGSDDLFLETMCHIDNICNRTPVIVVHILGQLYLDVIYILQHTEILRCKLEVIDREMISRIFILTDQDRSQRMNDNIVLNLDHDLILIKYFRRISEQQRRGKCHKRLFFLEDPVRIF